MAVARGDAPADLLLRGGRVVNVFTGEIQPANVAVHNGRIAGVGPYERGHVIEEVQNGFIAPGLIDAHMHVESTMMPPSRFARVAAAHGTTGAVLDPHEIANVLGLPGVHWVMDDARGAPTNMMFAASSCVPSSPLETAGAMLTADDLASLLDDPRVVALAEMMNFPGVVHGDADVLKKVNLGLERRVVDGHAPGLRGLSLQAYRAAGISSDHECTSADEAREKVAAGMTVFIREGSAARNLEALLSAVTTATAHQFCFCTDDRHPADLLEEGHINHVVHKAVALGMEAAQAVMIGSINVVRHYRLRDRGAIAPGHWADLMILDDLKRFKPRAVYFEGRLVAEHGACVAPMPSNETTGPRAPLRLPVDFGENALRIRATSPTGPEACVRVIGMRPGQLVTDALTMSLPVRDGCLMGDPARDLLKMAVIDRHRGTGIGLGFVRGFGIKRGAIASTVGHDAHNLAVIGTNDGDMVAAARSLAKCGGGQCAVLNGKLLALLPLPIAGLMSDEPIDALVAQQRTLLAAARDPSIGLGCPLHDPFMPLSFMCLPVIPSLKLTDKGLVDVDRFAVVPLEAP